MEIFQRAKVDGDLGSMHVVALDTTGKVTQKAYKGLLVFAITSSIAPIAVGGPGVAWARPLGSV